MSRRSADEDQTAAEAMFSSRRCSFVVPGDGTIHGFVGQPSQASTVGRASRFPLGDLAEQFDQGLIWP